MGRLEKDILAGAAAYPGNIALHIKILDQRPGGGVEAPIYYGIHDSPVGKFPGLDHDETSQAVPFQGVGIVCGKAEGPVPDKEKMVKISFRIAVVALKFRPMVVDFHADDPLKIFDICGVYL